MFCYALMFSSMTLRAHQGESLVKFTENKNQWDEQIVYRAQLDGGAMFLQKSRLTYHFYDKDTYRSIHANPKAEVKPIKTHWFHVNFLNSNAEVSFTSSNPTPDYNNYYLGKDKSKWASGVKNYKEVNYNSIWNGIKLQMIGGDNSLKYNFYVAPGADASLIQLQYQGVTCVFIKDGRLVIKTSLNEMIENAPYAYQIIDGAKKEVTCKFKLKNSVLTYDFPRGYNKNYELVIDPVLVFACSSGSTADNFGMTATYDSDGNLYSGGTVFDVGFPTTTNAYDSTYNSIVQYGQTDIVITKYDSSGTFLRYSTYLGGASDAEVINSLIVDAQDNLYLYGVTASSDFPMGAGAYDNTFNGGKTVRFYYNGAFFEHGTDIYISKINSTGTSLLGSTFIGGSQNDGLNYSTDSSLVGNIFPYGNVYQPNYDSLFFNYGDQNRGEIQLDNAGNVVVVSSTRSSDFPIANGFDNSFNGVQDAVVFKLNQGLTSLSWSTYFGGTSGDAGYALCLDNQNNVFITGGSSSPDLTITSGAFKPTYGGGKTDGYIAKIKYDGTVLLHSTYIGTVVYDQTYFVQLDNSANVFVFGQTAGILPVVNATYSVNNGRMFISKLDSTLGTLLMQTKFGNGGTTIPLSPSAFLVDCAENIYLSGWGGNIILGNTTGGLPITSNAYQSTTDGFNFYLMVLSKNANSLLYATYFGGPSSREHVDGGTSRFDKKGIIYQSVCAGCGGNDDFPVTAGSWPTSLYGSNWNQSSNCNNGTFKFNFEYAIPTAQLSSNIVNGCAPLTVNFTNTSISAQQFLWNFGGNDTTSTVPNPTHVFTNPGTYTVMLLAKNNACFNVWDTAFTTITVYPVPNAQAFAGIQPCTNTFNFTNNSSISSGTMTYQWNFGDTQTSTATNPTHTYAIGNYNVSLIAISNNGCKDTVVIPTIASIQMDSVGPGTSYCPENQQAFQLNAYGGVNYTWYPTTGLSSSTIANPIANVLTTTNYTVTITMFDGDGNTCTAQHNVLITVYPSITANFTSIANACGNTFQFTDNSNPNPISWQWNFGDASSSTIQNPTHSYTTAGTYNVSLITQNSFGCKDTIVKPVNLAAVVPISINNPQTICYGQQAQLQASGGVLYSWSPSNTLSNSTISNPLASPITTTIYNVAITTVNSNGDSCVSNLSTTVNVSTLSGAQLQTNANPDTIYVGESSSLTSNLNTPFTINWLPPYNISNASNFNTTASPIHTTTYYAVAEDQFGCGYLLDSVTIYVLSKTCDESDVFVPNTFTPNGDGKNDKLFARSNFISEIYFAVYNRWGQMVFETTDKNIGWDGYYNSMPADPSVYGYYLKYKCTNGQESFKKGNVTLVR